MAGGGGRVAGGGEMRVGGFQSDGLVSWRVWGGGVAWVGSVVAGALAFFRRISQGTGMLVDSLATSSIGRIAF